MDGIAGVPMLFTVLLLLQKGLPFEHALGTTTAAWILFGFVLTAFVIAMAIYKYVPAKRVIPIGVADWFLAVAITLWYFWFGPGALGHH